MECELEQYLAQIGLSSNMLKSESSSQVDDDAQPTSAAVSSSDKDKDEDDDDGAEACRPSEPVVDVTVATVDEVVISTTVFDDEGDRGDCTVSEVDPAAATASPTDVDCCTVADSLTTLAVYDTPSEHLVEHVALFSPDSSDNADETSTLQGLSSADDSSVQSCQQQTDTVNSNMAQVDCTEIFENAAPQLTSTTSVVVLNAVPHHVDETSTTSSSQIIHAPISSSCTIMLGGPTEDAVTRSPTTHRAAEDKQERERSDAEVAASVRRTSPDAMSSYTSTIIRCSSSLAPVIATKSSRDTDTPLQSRDTSAPATAVDDLETPPPAIPQIKTAANYVSVVQVGSATAVNERRVIPVTMTSNDGITNGSVALHSSPQTGRQHINISDAASCTPIKSMLKKPGHVKTKSVSFSTGSADDNDDSNNMSTTATTTETSTVRQPDAHHPSMAEAIVRLDRDRVDGIAPRRALVSDSGVFCEPEDDLSVLTSEDSKATTTQPSRRTTVIVSGGMASLKNSPRHHQREQLEYPTATKSDSQSSSTGGRTLNFTSNADSVSSQQVAAPGHSARTNVVSNNTETIKQLPTQDTTPDVRRKMSDTCTQVTSLTLSSPACSQCLSSATTSDSIFTEICSWIVVVLLGLVDPSAAGSRP